MECMAKWSESPHAWIPLSAVTHAQVANARGGMGRVHQSLIEAWAKQKLDEPWELVPGFSICLVLTCMVADHDAQRGALAAKGSAGLKPCAFCVNCIAKNAEATAQRDPHFRTIAECDFGMFQQHSTESLRQYMGKALSLPKTKGEHELQERVLGYRIERDNMWTSPMHVYANFAIGELCERQHALLRFLRHCLRRNCIARRPGAERNRKI
jgi:hypothetical protein